MAVSLLFKRWSMTGHHYEGEFFLLSSSLLVSFIEHMKCERLVIVHVGATST